MPQPKTTAISTILSHEIKKALTEYCKKRGLKMSHFIEEAIREHLEDEADMAAYEDRRNEDRISLSHVLKSSK